MCWDAVVGWKEGGGGGGAANGFVNGEAAHMILERMIFINGIGYCNGIALVYYTSFP